MIFLKLGGSLITDKTLPNTPRMDVIDRLADEIASAKAENDELRLLLGHGSGSFGHPAAARHRTHLGAVSDEEWRGFAEVWLVAQRLNRLVMDALIAAGLPAVSFPPSASAISRDNILTDLNIKPIRRGLQAGLLPVVYGDVAFDEEQGSTILSTEQIFSYLAKELQPNRVLLAGREPGVFASYPEREELLPLLNNLNQPHLSQEDVEGQDVTGGMAGKVTWALGLAKALPKTEIRIFSGEDPGTVHKAILGADVGTRIQD